MDASLPDLQPAAFAQTLAAYAAPRRTQLLLMLPFDERARGAAAQAVGFAGYLSKPVKQSHLLDAIASALHRAHLENGTRLLAPSRGDAPTAGAVPVAIPAQAGAPGAEPVIQVAEDNPVNQKLALLQLRKLGYRVDVVGNGRAAVAAVAARPYAVVLMDCQMPELDGFGATANAMQGDREACLAAGMDDYVSKPVKITELQLIVEHWLCAAEGELERSGDERQRGE